MKQPAMIRSPVFWPVERAISTASDATTWEPIGSRLRLR